MSQVAGFTGGHSPLTLGAIEAPFKAPLAAEFHIPSSWKRSFPLLNPRVFIVFYFVSLSAHLYLSSFYLIPASPQTTEYFAHHLPQPFHHLHPSLTTCGEDNGTPLQYSCLENPMDGGAW